MGWLDVVRVVVFVLAWIGFVIFVWLAVRDDDHRHRM